MVLRPWVERFPCWLANRAGGFDKADLKEEVFGHRDMRSADRHGEYQTGEAGEIMMGKACSNLVQSKNEVSDDEH